MMESFFRIFLFLVVFNLFGIFAITDPCVSQLDKYRVCMKQEMKTGGGASELTDTDRNQLQKQIETCFLNERCRSPFPAKNYLNATKVCYQSIRNESRLELRDCVRKDVPDFVLPEDESTSIDQRQNAVALLLAARNPYALCPFWVNKTQVAQCIKGKSDAFEQKSVQRKDLCAVRDSCNSTITKECLSKWNSRVVPALCRCASSTLIAKYKQKYQKCVEEKKFRVQYNDPTEFLVESSIKGWCPASNAKDPCTTPPVVQLAAKGVPPPKPTTTTQRQQMEGDVVQQATTTVANPNPVQQVTTTQATTTTTQASTTLASSSIFGSLTSDSVFQNLIASNPTLSFLQDLFTGKTDLSQIFPAANLLGNFQGGLTNIFGNMG